MAAFSRFSCSRRVRVLWRASLKYCISSIFDLTSVVRLSTCDVFLLAKVSACLSLARSFSYPWSSSSLRAIRSFSTLMRPVTSSHPCSLAHTNFSLSSLGMWAIERSPSIESNSRALATPRSSVRNYKQQT
ncbi:hypothetical protein NP493_750g00023 [Ridgeia piscesae]|uniref:Uncharacterized protein n=1 Tax=Ridgeia piscesae TaxID=27915 RepID=A0AAD9KPN2_RIDPI|nr:hypothetical protein NP493_750g00023 [Ridgeia piscesae]